MKRFLSVAILFSLTLFASAQGNVKTEAPDKGGISKPMTGKVDPVMTPYKRANFTQAIAKTSSDGGRSFPSTITPVPRNQTASQWRQSGGLEGIDAFRSDLFRYVPEGGEPYLAMLPVWNGSSFQSEQGWTRLYPDGTRFEDRLTNTETGKVFERRLAVKDKGKWTRRVIFSDPAQRPVGYNGLAVTCSSCHDSAPGTGGYASGLVPGADTVFSDPVSDLETGYGRSTASIQASEPLQEAFLPARGRRFGRR